MQGSYIGNTTASQAVKAGSIPVPCSINKDHPNGMVFVYGAGRNRKAGQSPVDTF